MSTATLSPRTKRFIASGRGMTDIDRKPDVLLEIRSWALAEHADAARSYYAQAKRFEREHPGIEWTRENVEALMAATARFANDANEFRKATNEAAHYYRRIRDMAGEQVARELAALYSERAGF